MGDAILIVDRNEPCRRLLRYLLEARGLHPSVAYDSKSALAAIAERTPDLVLLDLVLPDRDGVAFARGLSERGIRTIAVTGCAMIGDRVRALEAGCVGYIAKPIDTRTFAHLVMCELAKTS
ncbi:MAG: response regulator [Kofleriaceae bacterium]